MCSPRKHVTASKAERENENEIKMGRTSILLKVCECYIECSEDKLDEELKVKADIQDHVNEENDDVDSLVNETGSCGDENDEEGFWNDRMFAKDDSIYNVMMPKSFYELNESKNNQSGTKKHKRNLTSVDFKDILSNNSDIDSSLPSADKENNLKVKAWLDSGSPKFHPKKTFYDTPVDIKEILSSSTKTYDGDDSFQRKIHPKYAPVNNVHIGEDDNKNEYEEMPSGSKRKRIVSFEEPHVKKIRSSNKNWFSCISSWVSDFFK